MAPTAGALILDTGSPEGVLDASRGQTYKDVATGDTYSKTTAAGTLTGWRREVLKTDEKLRNAPATWLRASAIAQTFSRIGFAVTPHAPTSGTMYLAGGVVLPAGVPVTNIAFCSQAAAVTPTNQWFAIVSAAAGNAIRAKTADDTTTAWGATTIKSLAISGGPYTPTVDEMVYLGIVQVAATPATLTRLSSTPDDALRSASPPVFATVAPTGLTTPASLASITSIAAISSGGVGPLWAEVS